MTKIHLEYIKEMIAKGNVEEAIKSLASLLQSNNRDMDAWLLLAKLVDDPIRKKDCYKQVLKLSPDNPIALYELEKLVSSIAQPRVTNSASDLSQSSNQKIRTESRRTPIRSQSNGKTIWAGVFIGIIFICLLIAFMKVKQLSERLFPNAALNATLYAPTEQKIQSELEQEFKVITPLSTNNLIEYRAFSANDNNGLKYNEQHDYQLKYGPKSYVYVQATYLAGNYMPTVVFDHYDKQLREHGWKFSGNASNHGWDTTGKSSLWGNEFPEIIDIGAAWRKDKYCVLLTYHNYPSMTDSWEYTLSMNWSINNCSD